VDGDDGAKATGVIEPEKHFFVRLDADRFEYPQQPLLSAAHRQHRPESSAIVVVKPASHPGR
jgi:hypothetical protein